MVFSLVLWGGGVVVLLEDNSRTMIKKKKLVERDINWNRLNDEEDLEVWNCLRGNFLFFKKVFFFAIV